MDKAIEYLYDFGDDWKHSITLIGRALTSTTKVVCLSGEGSPAAEDCGGAYGWQELKATYGEHQECDCDDCCEDEAHDRMDWYSDSCNNGQESGFHPWNWDREAINKEFGKSKGLMARIAGE